MKLTAADVRGAFLQGLKIDRELYFELPSNTGKAMIKGMEPGSLLKLKKSIYGVNDASRQWCQSFRAILIQLGWEPLTFENAGFIFRFSGTKFIKRSLQLWHCMLMRFCWRWTMDVSLQNVRSWRRI